LSTFTATKHETVGAKESDCTRVL